MHAGVDITTRTNFTNTRQINDRNNQVSSACIGYVNNVNEFNTMTNSYNPYIIHTSSIAHIGTHSCLDKIVLHLIQNYLLSFVRRNYPTYAMAITPANCKDIPVNMAQKDKPVCYFMPNYQWYYLPGTNFLIRIT